MPVCREEEKCDTLSMHNHLSVAWLATRVVVMPHPRCNCTAAAGTEPATNTQCRRRWTRKNELRNDEFPCLGLASTHHGHRDIRQSKDQVV